MISRFIQFIIAIIGCVAFCITPVEILIWAILWVFTGKQWTKPLFVYIFEQIKYFNETKF